MVVFAKPSYYPNRGTLSLYATDIRMVGLGELLARLERRRQLLAAEGLFARELKRALPFLPHTIGLVTGAQSAAERDVLENARRRWPAVQFKVRHASMQGQNSAREVIEAVGGFDRDPDVDVIIVARGGGSVEDLLPFSDEGLIRAVHAARTTVVSAIGHEPDTPLLDLVADVRASTPTDAAKMVVPDVREELDRVVAMRDRGRTLITSWLQHHQQQLDAVRARPSLANPRSGLDDRSLEIDELCSRTRRTIHHQLDRAHNDLDHRLARVRSLSPLATLERGYAVLQDAGGHVVTRVAQVDQGKPLHVRVRDGRVHVTVTGTEPDPVAPPDTAAVPTYQKEQTP